MPSPLDPRGHLLEYLCSRLSSAGWRAEREVALPGDGGRADVLLWKGKRRWLGDLKIAREARRPEVEAQLANALLQSRASAKEAGCQPLAIVGAPSISDALAEHLRAFGQRYGEGQAFGFVDERGRLELYGEGFDGLAYAQGPPARQSAAGDQPGELFTDTNRWLLKVLLGQSLPPDFIEVPRGAIRHASDLAKLADVSLPTVARLANRLEEEGFVERGWRTMALVRVEDLLGRWRAANQRGQVEVGTRFLLPKKAPEDQLREALAAMTSRKRLTASAARRTPTGMPGPPPRACLGLFAAGSLYGIGLVQGVPSHLYVEEVAPDLLEELGLRQAEPGEQADVILRVARWPKSVFRGCRVVEGVPVSDYLQIWLDTRDHPLRGQAQADAIWNAHLAPQLVKDR